MSIPLPVIVFEAECSETVMGESVHVLGSISELGEWKLERSTALITSIKEFPLWRSCLFHLKSTPPDSLIQFKLLIRKDAQPNAPPVWEQCANRIFRCPQQGQLARVTAVFGRNNQISVTITEAALATALEAFPDEANRPRILVTSPPRQDTSPTFAASGEKTLQRESMGFNVPTDLQGLIRSKLRETLPAAALKIMTEHTRTRSLRQKYLLVKDILTARSETADLPAEDWVKLLLDLAYCAIYVSWVATATIPCGEDGGHHRPNQAAVAGQDILNFYESFRFKVSQRYAGSHRWEVDIFKYFSSLITPCLPSCASQFTCSVPLTRIRDIAHRNDISEELKREIKTRLQNKLHRCAGPEDLQTCKEFIHRFQSNPSAYPSEFMHQFSLFYQELRDFFNAADLTERLQAMQTNVANPRRSNAASWFLSNKFSFDKNQSMNGWQPLCDSLLSMMRCTTHLRMAVVDELEADAFRESTAVFFGSDPSHGQSLHIVDVQAEKLFFTLSSRMVNELEKVSPSGAFTKLSTETQSSILTFLLSSLSEALKHFACSGFARHYSLQLAQEIRQVHHEDDQEMMLIHCASIARRILRLCETFSDFLSATLPPNRTAEFAQSLGVQLETGRIVGEALIRSSLPFQASRCASLLLRMVEVEGLGRSTYVTLCANADSTGFAIATETLDSIGDLKENSGGELPIVVMVQQATGDEELEGLAARLSAKWKRPIRLAGILLSHEIPTMSHLGVRARQQGVAFVTLSDPLKSWESLVKEFEGRHISLQSGEPQQVSAGDAARVPADKRPRRSVERETSAGTRDGDGNLKDGDGNLKDGDGTLRDGDSSSRFLCCGDEITESDCGAKAAQCQRLFKQAEALGVHAPKCVALSKHAFSIALNWAENYASKTEILKCINSLQTHLSEGEEETICNRLRFLIECLELNEFAFGGIVDRVSSELKGETVLMVRSSSNVEDLEGMSAAGLYDSYPAVLRRSQDDWPGSREEERQPLPLNDSALSPSPLDDSAAALSLSSSSACLPDLWRAITKVWGSLWSVRAVQARRSAGVSSICWMAVLIQPLVRAEWSFVAQTRSMEGSATELFVELAQGLGEALAGGGRALGGGRPSRLRVQRSSGATTILCLTDFWAKFDPQNNKIVYSTLDALECSRSFYQQIGTQMLKLVQLEAINNNCPQDVEGCFLCSEASAEMTIVQSRPL